MRHLLSEGGHCRIEPNRLGGFSLVELLVVIAILGLLIQLMLPAVESSREAARQLSCTNNLKQIALATQLHHDTYGHLPTGGWHFRWTGDPDLGNGRDQPGGWVFNVLPFLEERGLHDLGKGLSGDEQAIAFGKRLVTALPVFQCPSRRLPRAYFSGYGPIYYTKDGLLSVEYPEGAKSDFAACVGGWTDTTDMWQVLEWEYPRGLADTVKPDFMWPDEPEFAEKTGIHLEWDGVIYFRSEVRYDQITDGLSNTYLVGEKYLERIRYKTGDDPGDNENMYTGFNGDINRSAYLPPLRDAGDGHFGQFGSTHPESWNMAFADGSVHAISYDIFVEVHRRLGSRNDGKSVNPDDF